MTQHISPTVLAFAAQVALLRVHTFTQAITVEPTDDGGAEQCLYPTLRVLTTTHSPAFTEVEPAEDGKRHFVLTGRAMVANEEGPQLYDEMHVYADAPPEVHDTNRSDSGKHSGIPLWFGMLLLGKDVQTHEGVAIEGEALTGSALHFMELMGTTHELMTEAMEELRKRVEPQA